MSHKVLAIGADGKFAGLVIPELARRAVTVRGLVRDPVKGDAVKARGAAEIAVGDLKDRASIDRALQGVDGVFYLAPAFLPGEAETGKALVAAVKAAGVKRFVFSSVIHPVLSALPNHANKGPVEEAILNSNLEYAFLHPALFFQNFAAGWGKVVETGVLAEPWSTETRFSRVDYRDVAEVAAMAMTDDKLLYGTFELCAPGALNRRGVAALMGEVLGREIEADRIDPAKLGPESAPMQPMFEHYDHAGLRGNSLTLTAILGREPRTLRAYFEELSKAEKGET